jgi:predicted nucleic acid-binding protein
MITMPVACVVDASVGIKLVIIEALSKQAHALFVHLARDPAARFYVPDLFDIECANVLWKQIQRSGYPLADAQHEVRRPGD